MPSLMLRGLPEDLVARVKAYARLKGLSLATAAVQLLTAALDRQDTVQRASRARWDRLSDEERREATAPGRAAAIAARSEDE